MSTVTLHLGDCLDFMPTLPAQSVDAIIADLPYGTTACEWDTVIPFEPLWAEYKRIIKPRGAVVLFGSQPFTSLLVTSNLAWFRYVWYWDKAQGGNFLNAKKQPLRRVEEVCVFSLNRHDYFPQLTDKSLEKQRKPLSRKPFLGGYIGATNGLLSDDYNPAKSYPTDLVKFSSRMQECNTLNRVHPTQKPVALLEYLVRTYTNPGDTVMDNTMGSGTTGVACVRMGRNFIGMEIDAGYFAIARRRIAEAQLQPPLIPHEAIQATQARLEL